MFNQFETNRPETESRIFDPEKAKNAAEFFAPIIEDESFDDGCKSRLSMIGVKKSDLDETTVRGVLQLYSKIAGVDIDRLDHDADGHTGEGVAFLLEKVNEFISDRQLMDLRYGAKLNGDGRNAKLIIDGRSKVVFFNFDPNTVHTRQGELMRNRFNAAVDWFLFAKGGAVFLSEESQNRDFFKDIGAKIVEDSRSTGKSWVDCAALMIEQAENDLNSCDFIIDQKRELLLEEIEIIKNKAAALNERYADKDAVIPETERVELLNGIVAVKSMIEPILLPMLDRTVAEFNEGLFAKPEEEKNKILEEIDLNDNPVKLSPDEENYYRQFKLRIAAAKSYLDFQNQASQNMKGAPSVVKFWQDQAVSEAESYLEKAKKAGFFDGEIESVPNDKIFDVAIIAANKAIDGCKGYEEEYQKKIEIKTQERKMELQKKNQKIKEKTEKKKAWDSKRS